MYPTTLCLMTVFKDIVPSMLGVFDVSDDLCLVSDVSAVFNMSICSMCRV